MSIWSGIITAADNAYSLIPSPFGSSSSLDWSKLGMGALGMGAQLGSDILGGALSYHTNKKLQKQSYKYARRLQQFQFDWQERMSNTAHQREVEDLRSAGLNPILSATGGNGAAVPSGSGGTPVSAPGGNAFGGVGGNIDILSTILQLKRLESDIKVNDSIASKNLADADKARVDMGLSRSMLEVNVARARNVSADTVNKKLISKSLFSDAETAHYRHLGAKSDYYSLEGKLSEPIKLQFGDTLLTFNNISIRDALVLQRLAKAYNDNRVSSNTSRKIISDIRNIDARTDLINVERSMMIHNVIQGYIKNVTDGIFAVKGIGNDPLDYVEMTQKTRGGVIRSRQYNKK